MKKLDESSAGSTQYFEAAVEHEYRFLTRIFHHFRDEKVAKADGVRQTKDFDQGCMSTYCPDQNSSLTEHPSDFPAFAVERDEISGLMIMHSKNSCCNFF